MSVESVADIGEESQLALQSSITSEVTPRQRTRSRVSPGSGSLPILSKCDVRSTSSWS